MQTLCIPCPTQGAALTTGQNGAVTISALCSDQNQNALINGQPTLFLDCTTTEDGFYTVIESGQTYTYQGSFTHTVTCQPNCGPAAPLPPTIFWETP